jgi:predicted enzyme related to lactoylglutathione lyase
MPRIGTATSSEIVAMPNHIVWVDIPVLKLDRAMRFYSAIIGSEVEKQDYPGMSIGSFPHKDGEAAGCLYLSDTVKPSAEGPLVYLNVHGRLNEAIEAVVPSGGTVLLPKESMGPFGFRAIVLDTEGNRIALHSM